jgi:hypothetical protein
LDKGDLSRTVTELETKGYVKHIKGTKKPKLYEKGPNAGELDTLIVGQKSEVYARGVTQISKKYALIGSANVHHLKYKARVLRVGDMQFLRSYYNRRNVQRFKGQIPYYEHFITVEYEKTPKHQNFYVYPPQMNLTGDELGHYEEKAGSICQDILNGISKKAGWKFGLPEKTKWETHIAVDSPALMGGLAGKYYMESQDGTAFISNSEGRDEIEFKSQGLNDEKAIKQAKIMLELPGQVIELSTKLSELERDLEQLVRILSLQKTSVEKLAEINGVIIKTQVEETISKTQTKTTDFGGMYQ